MNTSVHQSLARRHPEAELNDYRWHPLDADKGLWHEFARSVIVRVEIMIRVR
jgi:hypothetical protein